MSEGRGRKPAKDSTKGFFKANPPKRDLKKTSEEKEIAEAEVSIKSGSPSATEENENNQNNQNGSEQIADNSGEPSTGEPPAKKRRRRKRRVLLTDTAVKAKKRAEKKLIKEANTATDNVKKEGAESPTKKEKEKEVTPEPLDKKPAIAKYTPSQLLYDHILRKLISKDPEEFFTHPVQPSMAPDYLNIIEQPMDFMTIRNRIDANEYENIDQFRRDISLIWENAMTYNQPNTIYYIAAQKLSVVVKYYLSEQYLEYLRYTLPFGKQLATSELRESEARRKPANENVAAKRRETFVTDNLKADDIIKAADAKLKSRLTNRVPACGIGYLDNKDGALALNVLVNAGDADDLQTGKKRLTLGDIVPPLESGNPGVLSFVEPRLCHDYTISYTEPGPYASFAPQFDSTWATLNKYDSDLLIACYGDRANTADAIALRQMVADCNTDDEGDDVESELVRHVDALLDSLTDGEHSLTMKALKERPQLNQSISKPLSRSTMMKMLENVKSLRNLGLDLSYIDDLISELGLNETKAANPSDLLESTGKMLSDLTTLNYNRLNMQPPMVLTDVGVPTSVETQLAQNVLNGLNTSVQNLGAKPADVVSSQTIHKSLGLAGDDDDDYDYDLLREFMCVDDLEIDGK